MRWFFDWAHGVADDVRKPIDKNGYRILALVAVLVDLSLATIVLISSRDWELALLCALFALPASLLAGGLCILRRQRLGAVRMRARRRKIAILLLSFGAFLAVAYGKPSDSERLIVITLVVALMAIARPSIFGNYPRLPPQTVWQRARWMLASLAVILVTLGALMQLQYLVHAELAEIIVWVIAIILITRSGVFGHIGDT